MIETMLLQMLGLVTGAFLLGYFGLFLWVWVTKKDIDVALASVDETSAKNNSKLQKSHIFALKVVFLLRRGVFITGLLLIAFYLVVLATFKPQ